MGALEPKFWAAFCRGVGREDSISHQFDAPGLGRACEVEAVLSARTRAEWEAFNAEHDCCLEPVLELDEVVGDEQVGRARDGRRRAAGDAGAAVRDARRLPRGGPPGLGEHTAEVLGEAGYDEAESAALRESGRRSDAGDAFFVPLGDGRFRATERTSGPWDPRHQHAGPPSALLTGLLERTAPRDDMVLARVTVEILGAVPIAEVEVETSVERPGRSVELLAGELRARRAGGAARAGVARARLAGRDPSRAAGRAARGRRPAAAAAGRVVRLRERGRVALGARRLDRARARRRSGRALRIPVVEGEEPTPRQRVMVVADSGNGASNVLDWARYLFINTELTVHFLREPVGEWVLLDARDARSPRAARGSRRRCSATGRGRWLAARRRCSSRHAELGRHEGDRAAASRSLASPRLRLRFRLGLGLGSGGGLPGPRRATRAARRTARGRRRSVPRARSSAATGAGCRGRSPGGRRRPRPASTASSGGPALRECCRSSRCRRPSRSTAGRRARPAPPRPRGRPCARATSSWRRPGGPGRSTVATWMSVTSEASRRATASTHASHPPSVIHARTFRSRATARPYRQRGSAAPSARRAGGTRRDRAHGRGRAARPRHSSVASDPV